MTLPSEVDWPELPSDYNRSAVRIIADLQGNKMRFVIALLLSISPAFAFGQAVHEVAIESVGKLCVIKSDVPITFTPGHPARWEIYQADDLTCVVSTESAGEVVVVGTANGNPRPRVDRWIITIGAPVPVPVPPNPVPVPPIPPPPAPEPIATWSEQIRMWTEALPVTQRQQAPQVKQAFEKVAAAIGVTAFTGPDIRTETAKALSTVPGFAGWAAWDTQRTDADAAWARETYRDAAAYKQRWGEVVAGLALVKVPGLDLPVVIQGTQVTLQPQVHQIRNGRLLQYVCPQNGQRCRWQDMGEVVSRGPGWVIIQ